MTKETLADTRHFYDLLPGERFKALIVDIKPGQVTIRLNGGGTFTARTRVLPEARIGEESFFTIRENNQKGQILLEMVKLDPDVKQSNMLREALGNAGLVASDENLALGKLMIANNLPVDAATLQKAAFFSYARTDMTPEKVIFFLRENLPADVSTLQQINSILNNPFFLRDTLETLSAELPNEMRKHLFLFIDNESKKTFHKSLMHYYHHLLETLDNAEQALSVRDEGSRTLTLINSLRDFIHIISHINKRRAYYQVPFVTDSREPARQAELFVFKDVGASILIALNTESLGRVEVFAQKMERQTQIQLRCHNEKTLRIVSGQSARLTQSLSEQGIPVSSVTCTKTDEIFTLLSPSPSGMDETEKKETVPKRFAFDMRV